MREVAININAQVTFETTNEGARVMREFYACTPVLTARDIEWLASRRTLPLWEVMQVFGPHTRMGGPALIKGNMLRTAEGECVNVFESAA